MVSSWLSSAFVTEGLGPREGAWARPEQPEDARHRAAHGDADFRHGGSGTRHARPVAGDRLAPSSHFSDHCSLVSPEGLRASIFACTARVRATLTRSPFVAFVMGAPTGAP